MTYAWYGHLKTQTASLPIWKLLLISWGIAFFEYLFMVPANNFYGKLEGYTPFQLKTIQEVISLVIFGVFAVFILKEKIHWNHIVSFILLTGAVWFMFLGKK